MKRFTYFSLVASFALIFFAGCDTTVENDDPAMLSFDLDATFAGTPLIADGSQTYSLDGRNIVFESARMYLSGITLIGSDGTEYPMLAETPLTTVARDADGNDVAHTVDEHIVLVKHDAGTTRYHLGEVAPGTYSGFRVSIGINGQTNKVDASQIPESHPLGKQTDRNNHWSWNSGYIFLRLDGKVDADSDGVPESQWDVHLGTASYLQTMTFNEAFELNPGEEVDLHVIIDYARFLAGLDYSDPTQHICHTMDNIPVAQIVGANVENAFEFHGVHVLDGHDH